MTSLGFLIGLALGAASWAGEVAAQRTTVPARKEQQRTPQLRAVADLQLTGSALGLSGNGFGRNAHLGVAPDGRIVIAPQMGEIFDVDSTGHRLSWKIAIGSRNDEIRTVERLGWAGNTMWIVDPSFGQIALVDRSGKITKSLEHPSWVRPAWADRRKFPVFARVRPLALYADGSWLVIPYRERSLLDTPEYDKSFEYILRISEGGSIQRTVARLPREPGSVVITSGKRTRTLYVPYVNQAVWDVSADGTRVAIVAVNMRGPDSATFRVSTIGEKGDTVFSRLYPYTPVKVPSQARDSVRERIQGRVGTRSEDEVRDLVVEKMPPFYPPVSALVVGRDHTIWLLLRGTGTPASAKPADDRTWMVLDPAGAPIGTVALPKDFFLEEAERQRAWGFDRRMGQPPVMVRYRVTAGGRG